MQKKRKTHTLSATRFVGFLLKEHSFLVAPREIIQIISKLNKNQDHNSCATVFQRKARGFCLGEIEFLKGITVLVVRQAGCPAYKQNYD